MRLAAAKTNSITLPLFKGPTLKIIQTNTIPNKNEDSAFHFLSYRMYNKDAR